MFEFVDELVSDLKLQVVESIDLPPRRQSRTRIPDAYSSGKVASAIAEESPDGRLWKHQSQALRHLVAGRNVVVSTGTASGKSLIFQLHAFHRLLTESDSKVLVLYPQRSLANDQLHSWQDRAKLAGLKSEEVAYVSSDIKGNKNREQIIQQARVVLMTPDLCHAWLLRTIDSAPVSRFLDSLSLLILDEAHTYESVFGSNLAFLIRRMLTAKHRLYMGPRKPSSKLQAIAATATIDEPAKHLEELTGLKFRVVDEDKNGAPSRQRAILHVDGPDGGGDGEGKMADIIKGICNLRKRHRFIAFMDSRQGVERIVDEVSRDDVKTYRSGIEDKDRVEIEKALSDGTLCGVVSTSALELGIDIRDIEIGINLGVPQSRKSFRQRLGRIGRHSPGVFIVVASPNAFKQFGENLKDYYDSSVEPSYLYLGNRFIQFANARCLKKEMDGLSWNSSRPSGTKWPDGFRDRLKFAREGIWPPEYNKIDERGSDSPHFNFPLRELGEKNIKFQSGTSANANQIGGSISHQQAIREAFPGAHYLHNGKRYKVVKWKEGFDEISICLLVTKDRRRVRPVPWNSFVVNVPDGIVEGRVKRGKSGFIAEAEIHVNESVIGYRIGNSTHNYSDLQGDDRNMKSQSRRFDTTGVILKIEEDWFKSPSVKGEVAEGLFDLLCRDKSIKSHDIDWAYKNVRIQMGSSLHHSTDAILIYDSVYGGLRLTENLYDGINDYMDKLGRAVEMAGESAVVRKETLGNLQAWLDTLNSSDTVELVRVEDSNWLPVYKPGSVVATSNNYLSGVIEYEIVEPVYSDPFDLGTPKLAYKCKVPSLSNPSEVINHESIDPFGRNSELVLWNPDTGEFRELEDSK